MKKKGISSPFEAVFTTYDILSIILLRFPLKQLLRWKIVSKSWYAVISDADFRRSHLHRHRSRRPSAVLFNGDYLPPPFFETVFLNPGSSPTLVPTLDFMNIYDAMILSSCNGLLLCSAKSKSLFNPLENSTTRTISPRNQSMVRYQASCARLYGFTYFICNPTINQFTPIPPITPWDWKLSLEPVEFSLYIAFNPLKSPDFKIVALRRFQGPCHFQFRLDTYSSSTGVWSDDKVIFEPPFGMGIAAGVFCKGAIHWYSNDRDSVCFHVDTQILKRLPMPPKIRRRVRRDIGYFGTCGDHLHMVLLDYPKQGFEILELHDDYSGWSPRYHVDYSFIRRSFPGLVTDDLYSILCVVEGYDDDEDPVVVFMVGGMVLSYNLMNHTLRSLQNLEPYGIKATSDCINMQECLLLARKHCGVFQFIESFASCV